MHLQMYSDHNERFSLRFFKFLNNSNNFPNEITQHMLQVQL